MPSARATAGETTGNTTDRPASRPMQALGGLEGRHGVAEDEGDDLASSSRRSALRSARRWWWAPRVPRWMRGRRDSAPLGQHLVQVAPGLITLSRKALKVTSEALERDASAAVNSAQTARYAAVMRGAANALARWRVPWRAFALGFEGGRRALPPLSELLGADRVHSVTRRGAAQGDVSSVELLSDSREIMLWLREQAPGQAAVLLLAASDAHLQLLVAAVQLSARASTGRVEDLAAAHALLARRTAFAANRAAVVCSPVRRRRRLQWATRGSLSGGAKLGAGTAKGGKGQLESTECAARSLQGVSEMRTALASTPDVEAACARPVWRRMVLRKLVLSEVPRPGAGAQSCRPYVMVMNGNQQEFLYSTMVSGIREFACNEHADISFDVNCRVTGDVLLKLYHMAPGCPGAMLGKALVDVSTAEPVEDPAEYALSKADEQLVVVTVPRQAIRTTQPELLSSNFFVQLLFGMPAEMRALHQQGPKAFASGEALSAEVERISHGDREPPSGQDGEQLHEQQQPRRPASSVAGPMDLASAGRMPRVQFKCSNSLCGLTQYVHEAPGLVCADCGRELPLAPSVAGILKQVGTLRASSEQQQLREQAPGAVGASEAGGIGGGAATTGDGTKVANAASEAETPPMPPRPAIAAGSPSSEDAGAGAGATAAAEQPPLPPRATAGEDESAMPEAAVAAAAEAGGEAEEEEEYNVEADLQSRIEPVSAVLVGTSYTPDEVERQLRVMLSLCSSREQADGVVQSFVSAALGDGESDGESEAVAAQQRQQQQQREARVAAAAATLGGQDFFVMSESERVELLADLFGLAAGRGPSFASEAPSGANDWPRGYRRRGYGLRVSEISRLPTHAYVPGTGTAESGAHKACSVCLLPFEAGDQLRTLPCFHSYHTPCIDRWLADNSKCPVCQREAHNVDS